MRELENFDHIELTADEVANALREARERKYYRLQELEREARAAEFRRMLTERWSYEKTKTWIASRIDRVFQGENIAFEDLFDEHGNQVCNAGSIYELLCYYFSGDANFVLLARKMEVPEPDLRKGILLAGRIGCGKTSLMRLFQRNQRQVYMIQSAKEIARKWRQADAEKNIEGYMESLTSPYLLPLDDSQNFYHRHAGLCIDDVGTEDIQNSYGNRASVIADVIEGRYYNRCMGPLFHMTTNLTMPDVKEYYGSRVGSRLREMMNVIQYKGEDRRH